MSDPSTSSGQGPATSSGQSDVLLDKRPDGVALITLNRPDSLNAMGGQLMPLLAQYLAECAYDTSVRAVVVTGAGRAFCAGGDVKDMGRRPGTGGATTPGGDPSASSGQAPSDMGRRPGTGGATTPGGDPSASSGQAPSDMGRRPGVGGAQTSEARPASAAPAQAAGQSDGQRPSVFQLLDPAIAGLRDSQLRTSYMLHTMGKPTIAAVNGHAVGAGLSLALAADLRIASDRAKFGTAFRNVGFSGDYGGSFYMQRLVGMGKARELYFTAEIIEADEALRIGMVTRVVAHDKLMDETLAFAAKLASGPTAAYARMKENLNLGEHADLRALLDQEALYMRLTALSNDHRNAVRAFVEKSEPKFAGN